MSYPLPFSFDQELALAKRRISARLQHLKSDQRIPLLAQLWVQWIKEQNLFNESRSSRHGQGGQA